MCAKRPEPARTVHNRRVVSHGTFPVTGGSPRRSDGRFDTHTRSTSSDDPTWCSASKPRHRWLPALRSATKFFWEHSNHAIADLLVVSRPDKARVDLTWEETDDGERASGRGWVEHDSNDAGVLRGHIYPRTSFLKDEHVTQQHLTMATLREVLRGNRAVIEQPHNERPRPPSLTAARVTVTARVLPADRQCRRTRQQCCQPENGVFMSTPHLANM